MRKSALAALAASILALAAQAQPVQTWGRYLELTWDGKSANGRSVSAGMYVVRISTVSGGKSTEFTRKAVTIKPL